MLKFDVFGVCMCECFLVQSWFVVNEAVFCRAGVRHAEGSSDHAAAAGVHS